MRSREQAELLLRKAAQDEFTIAKLVPDPASPDEVIGFHAQQAVEKILKAVLAFVLVRYRRTHDLAELIDLLRDKELLPLPEELEEVRRHEFRYGDMPEEPEEPFDRAWALECVRKTRRWAESLIRSRQEGS